MGSMLFRFLILISFSAPVWAAEEGRKALTGGDGAAGNLLQVTLGLALVLGLIFVAAWAVKRYTVLPGGASGALRVVSVLPMGQREKVVLVQVGEKQLLLGVAPGRISTLHVLDENIETVKAGSATQGGFPDRFRAALKERLTS